MRLTRLSAAPCRVYLAYVRCLHLNLPCLRLSNPPPICSKYLSAQCPEGWPYGVMDDLGYVVQQLPSTGE